MCLCRYYTVDVSTGRTQHTHTTCVVQCFPLNFIATQSHTLEIVCELIFQLMKLDQNTLLLFTLDANVCKIMSIKSVNENNWNGMWPNFLVISAPIALHAKMVPWLVEIQKWNEKKALRFSLGPDENRTLLFHIYSLVRLCRCAWEDANKRNCSKPTSKLVCLWEIY